MPETPPVQPSTNNKVVDGVSEALGFNLSGKVGSIHAYGDLGDRHLSHCVSQLKSPVN